MRVIHTVGAYNDRRYGRPWLARVTDWPVGGKPTLTFGSSVGMRLAEIEAQPGDVVRYGQKDYRKINGSYSYWGIVSDEGKITDCTPREARDHWLKVKGNGNPA